MKVRNGFISNSSSSSFVVATKHTDVKVKLVIEVDLEEFLDEDLIYTKEQLDGYIMEQYGWGECNLSEVLNDSEQVSDMYTRCLKKIEEGNRIYFCTASNEDYNNPAAAAIYDGADFKILNGEVIYNER